MKMLESAFWPGEDGVTLSLSVWVQNTASCTATLVEKRNISNLGLEGLQVTCGKASSCCLADLAGACAEVMYGQPFV